MLQNFTKGLVFVVFFSAIAVTTCYVHLQNESYASDKTFSPFALLNKKIEYYRHLYPEITFLPLQGGDDLSSEMVTLNVVLGYQPRSMDYEHPVELREDLMFVSVERIRFMLQSRLPSATVFKVDAPSDWQELVCVLTISPYGVAENSIQATQHLLDLPRKMVKKIPQDMQLSAEDYLAFVIDHEVYHCLKSIFVGPQPMSHKELWANFNNFHEEQAADAYALAMHVKNHGEDSTFANNVLRIRGMALYSADPDHLTSKGLEQILKIPKDDIKKMSANDIFGLAISIRHLLTQSYDDYVQYQASAAQAIRELGFSGLANEINVNNNIQADPAQVKELVTNARSNFAELFGAELIP